MRKKVASRIMDQQSADQSSRVRRTVGVGIRVRVGVRVRAHMGALDADADRPEGAAVHDVLQAALVAELQQQPRLLELLALRLLGTVRTIVSTQGVLRSAQTRLQTLRL